MFEDDAAECKHCPYRKPGQWQMRPVVMVEGLLIVDKVEVEHVDVGQDARDEAEPQKPFCAKSLPQHTSKEVAGGEVGDERICRRIVHP